jgi:hypothetical protein
MTGGIPSEVVTMDGKALRVVSISIGSSKRDKDYTAEILGHRIYISRIGTDGSFEKAAKLMRDMASEVDCFGLGGMDMYLWTTKRRYVIRDAAKLAQNAGDTPVVDGSDLKHTHEKRVVQKLFKQGYFKSGQHCLMTSGVDRMGMAQGLNDGGMDFIFGDLIFALKIPIAIRSYRQINTIGSIMLPILTRLPFKWLYPTGGAQEKTEPKFGRFFDWADVIAGDFHYIRKYMPMKLTGKTILTNTTTEEDVEMLRARDVRYLITTTPRMGGRSFGANVLQAMIVAISGKRPEELTWDDYLHWADKLKLEPDITELNPHQQYRPKAYHASEYGSDKV